MSDRLSPVVKLIDELRRRRVFHVAAAYIAGALVVLEGADLLLSPLGLGDRILPVLVGVVIVGFPLALAFAWAYELTAEGLRRTGSGPGAPAGADGPGAEGPGAGGTGSVPGPVAAGAPAPLPLRRQLQIFGLFVVAALVAVGAAAVVLRTVEGPPRVERTKLAVFPFRAIGSAVADWAEGAPDLLSTVLDGTEGLQVADPWALWRPLRSGPSTRPGSPAPRDAAELAASMGAGRYLLGSVVDAGDSVTVSLRLYEVGRDGPAESFAVAGIAADLAGTVRRAAVAVLGRLTREDVLASPAELTARPTDSPEALKAYLAAREAMRRGLVDSAEVAIDRAVALDSTFVLALVEATIIKSWVAHVQGHEFRGLLPLLDAAAPFAKSTNQRTRLRLEATRASVMTDGPAAVAAARRILAMDSTDIQAWSSLQYYLTVYGWQVGAGCAEALAAAERVVRLDSTLVPGLAARAGLAARCGDTEDARTQLERLVLADTTSPLARGMIAGLRAALADDGAFRDLLPGLTRLPQASLPTVVRVLRHSDLARARTLLLRLGDAVRPGVLGYLRPELARIEAARGRPDRVDSLARAAGPNVHPRLDAFLVPGALAGMIPETDARPVVDAMAAYVPLDSANAYFDTRPVWLYGWMIGAFHATHGDTAVSHRWAAVFDTVPEGGSPPRWADGLAADIRSRIASRRGDPAAALDRARAAFRLWSIHTENASELMPEPSIRLNLGMLYAQAAVPDSARALLSSLTAPSGWFGFLTARSCFELGEVARANGDDEAARRWLRRALEFWEDGGPAVAMWRDEARRRLAGSDRPATVAR
ncbi:MAG: hypothetical protein ACOCUW_01415 [Gemmatimonadota bacterium]